MSTNEICSFLIEISLSRNMTPPIISSCSNLIGFSNVMNSKCFERGAFKRFKIPPAMSLVINELGKTMKQN